MAVTEPPIKVPNLEREADAASSIPCTINGRVVIVHSKSPHDVYNVILKTTAIVSKMIATSGTIVVVSQCAALTDVYFSWLRSTPCFASVRVSPTFGDISYPDPITQPGVHCVMCTFTDAATFVQFTETLPQAVIGVYVSPIDLPLTESQKLIASPPPATTTIDFVDTLLKMKFDVSDGYIAGRLPPLF